MNLNESEKGHVAWFVGRKGKGQSYHCTTISQTRRNNFKNEENHRPERTNQPIKKERNKQTMQAYEMVKWIKVLDKDKIVVLTT